MSPVGRMVSYGMATAPRKKVSRATFTLKPAIPFRLDLTVWVLRRVSINEIDRWDGRTYRRVFVLGDTPVATEVTQTGPPAAPRLKVTATAPRLTLRKLEQLRDLLENALGLNVKLAPFYDLASRHEALAQLAAPFLGFRPPRLPSMFETLVNGIACQQVSLVAGLYLLNRLSSTYGLSAGQSHAFPRPRDLAGANPQQLRLIGFSMRKGQYILDLSRAVASGELDLESLSALDDAAAIERLQQLSGVGRWTAEYALLRGLGRLDVFPADDIGAQNKLQEWLGLKSRPDYARVNRVLQPFRPYRGLIYFHMLMSQQQRKGLYNPPA